MEQVFKVLSDFSRVRILNMLTKGNWCVTEMSRILNMSISSVSRHLSKLRLVGILNSEQDAQWVHNVIDETFYEDNKLLFLYIEDIAKRDKTIIEDNNKLEKYKQSGLTCRDICEFPNKIDDIIKGDK